MSEIKFRAWCKQYGDPGFMVYPGDYNDEFITFDGKPIEIKVSQYEYEADELKYELMQYTGLKDKNGKEIYEGDVVRHQKLIYTDCSCNEVKEVRPPTIGEMFYYEGVFLGLRNEVFETLFLPGPIEPEEFELIGNIYENPDLINS